MMCDKLHNNEEQSDLNINFIKIIDTMLKKRMMVVLFSGLVFGLMSHGIQLFNKYSYHDDIVAFNSVGSTFNLGRWMLGLMGMFVEIATRGSHYSIPLINGSIAIACITIISFIIVEQLKIKRTSMMVIVTGLAVAFPTVTGLMGYMFTVPYYYFGTLMGVLGAYIFFNKKNIITFLICTLLMACSTGTYQANIPISICVLLLFSLNEIKDAQSSVKVYIKILAEDIGICLGFIIEYFILNGLMLKVFNITESDYVNDYGSTGIYGYISRVMLAYKEFVYPTKNSIYDMYPGLARYLHIFLVIIVIILAIVFLIQQYEDSVAKSCFIGILFLAYPIAAYFIFVMLQASRIHGLMTYGELFTIYLAAWIIDNIQYKHRYFMFVKNASILLMTLMLFTFVRFSNICYMKAEVLQSQSISYFSELTTRIRMAEGYKSDGWIIYINELEKDESVIRSGEFFDDINIYPYSYSSLINDYGWRRYMAFWCGFNPNVCDVSSLSDEGLEIIEQMPCYPDDGSIQMIEDIVVVKFR